MEVHTSHLLTVLGEHLVRATPSYQGGWEMWPLLGQPTRGQGFCDERKKGKMRLVDK